MPVKNCYVITKPDGRNTRTRDAEWKVIIMDRDGPHRSCGKKALNHHIFIISYLQSVERKHLQAALSSTGYGAAALARKLDRWQSVSGIAAHLKDGSMKPSGAPKEI